MRAQHRHDRHGERCRGNRPLTIEIEDHNKGRRRFAVPPAAALERVPHQRVAAVRDTVGPLGIARSDFATQWQDQRSRMNAARRLRQPLQQHIASLVGRVILVNRDLVSGELNGECA